jgi:pimeloyl-ACP methyl ester carboxylesterase
MHGFTDSWFSWTPVLERLPAGVRAIVPTQRGHGDSDRPVCCYRVGDFARDAVALLDALGIERAHVVGHSMGGIIAQRIALDSPERVDRLVIIGSAESARNDVVIEFNDVVQQLEDPIDPAFIRDFQISTTAVPLPPAFLDGVVAESGKLPARIWRDVLRGLVDPAEPSDASGIRAPTLVVWGAKDAFFPRSGQDSLVRVISGSRLVVYPDAAHSPNWEIPDRLVAELVAFLGLGG